MLRATFKTRPTRALCFDLENRPLAYWYDGQTTSQITAFGWKWADEKQVQTLLLRTDGWYVAGDGRLFASTDAHHQFRALLASADLVYGHNIRKHDLSMFQAWLLRLQLPPLPELRTTDTLRDIPKRNGVSASLENLASMYGIEGEKLTMTQPMWERANQLTDDGVELARERVVSDVLLQERLRNKMLDLGILRDPRTWKP